MSESKRTEEQVNEQVEGQASGQIEGESAEFMEDAPGAKIQSCVPTLKVENKKVSTVIPMAPPK